MNESRPRPPNCSQCGKLTHPLNTMVSSELPGVFCSTECIEAKLTSKPFLPARGQRVRVVEIHPKDHDAGCKMGDTIAAINPVHEGLDQYWGSGWLNILHDHGVAICRVAPVEEANSVQNGICPPVADATIEWHCHCGQLAKAGGQCADCRQDTERGTLGLPALSEAGALQARRLESAKAVMGAVMVKRKRVEWIQPGHPVSFPSNEGDDEP